MTRLLLLSLIITAFSACSGGSKEAEFEPKPGEVKYTVNLDSCAKWNLPPVNFSLYYPQKMNAIFAQEGIENPNYIQFYNAKDSLFMESLSIGFFRLDKGETNDQLNTKLLENFKKEFEMQGLDMSKSWIGKKVFDGKEYSMMTTELALDIDVQLKGKYKLLFLLVPPQKGNTNGVMMIFSGHENSVIKDYDDFATKGDVSRIWKSFRYEEAKK